MAVQEVTAQAWPPLPVFAITTSDRGACGSALSSSGARVQNVVLADSGLPGSALWWGGGGLGEVWLCPPARHRRHHGGQ